MESLPTHAESARFHARARLSELAHECARAVASSRAAAARGGHRSCREFRTGVPHSQAVRVHGAHHAAGTLRIGRNHDRGARRACAGRRHAGKPCRKHAGSAQLGSAVCRTAEEWFRDGTHHRSLSTRERVPRALSCGCRQKAGAQDGHRAGQEERRHHRDCDGHGPGAGARYGAGVSGWFECAGESNQHVVRAPGARLHRASPRCRQARSRSRADCHERFLQHALHHRHSRTDARDRGRGRKAGGAKWW